MVSVRKLEPATYDDYLALPEDQKAELIDGELFLMSGPKGRHVRIASNLGSAINTRYGQYAGPTAGGPGGWWIFFEPEVHLRLDRRVVRPDTAGWRRERMPAPPEDTHKFTTVPDWVCEILSPSTMRWDMLVKMPRYLEAGVRHVWIVDPVERRIDALRVQDGEWVDAGSVEVGPTLALPPFEDSAFDLTPIWGPPSA